MCWKYEWARAISNLHWVRIHTERALNKCRKRGNREAAAACVEVIVQVKSLQGQLERMIEIYGISRTGSSQAQKLAAGKRTKRGKIEGWGEEAEK